MSGFKIIFLAIYVGRAHREHLDGEEILKAQQPEELCPKF
jgi:hypothetical protein